MSFNTNNPNQQWQQQQVQPVNPQATPTTSPPGGVNYQQSQQSYNFQNGNMQGQHHQSQQSWSWQGQNTTPAPIIQSPPILQSSSVLLHGSSHHHLHQQMHQSALNHSQQALAHHQQILNMQQNMARNMASMMSGVTPTTIMQQPNVQQIAYQNVSPAQQQQQRPAITSPSSVPPQPQYQQVIYQPPQQYHGPISQSPQDAVLSPEISQQHSAIQQNPQQNPPSAANVQTQQLTQGPAQQAYHDSRYDALDKQRKKDIDDMNRAGAQISQRLRDLEQSNARAQSNQDAKNREVRQLQEQLAAVNRQRLQDAERNSQQLAELVRSQAASPAAQTPAFNMIALQKVIRETQARQPSSADIERVIEEQVSKRLAGMATKADIQHAGAQMQNALSQVPAGLNEQQVQQAVNRELNNVMQDVANRVNQHRPLAGDTPQNTQPMQDPRSQVQTDFVVEELSDDDDVVVHRVPVNYSTSPGAGPIGQLQGIDQAVPTTSAPGGPVLRTSVTNVVQQQMPQQPPGLGQSSQTPRYAAIETNPRGTSNDLAMQPQSSAPPASSIAGQRAIQVAPSISGTNLQTVQSGSNVYLPSMTSATSMTPVAQRQQTVPVQQAGGRTQQLTLEAPFAQQTVPQSSLTAARPGFQAQAAPSRPQQAMLEASPAGPVMPGNAVALVNSSTAPSTMSFTHHQNVPQSGYVPQQIQAAMPQRQLEAAPAPVQQLGMVARYAEPQTQGVAQVAAQQQHVSGAAPYRQLEAAPVPMQQLQMTRPQSIVSQTQGSAQMATQPQQIASSAPMRQLEALPGSSINLSATGQELVQQSGDIVRNAPRR